MEKGKQIEQKRPSILNAIKCLKEAKHTAFVNSCPWVFQKAVLAIQVLSLDDSQEADSLREEFELIKITRDKFKEQFWDGKPNFEELFIQEKDKDRFSELSAKMYERHSPSDYNEDWMYIKMETLEETYSKFTYVNKPFREMKDEIYAKPNTERTFLDWAILSMCTFLDMWVYIPDEAVEMTVFSERRDSADLLVLFDLIEDPFNKEQLTKYLKTTLDELMKKSDKEREVGNKLWLQAWAFNFAINDTLSL